MATTKQIEANRRNARQSTGPKSAVGKLIASQNAMRHGFYSTSVVLPDEDRDEFLRLARRLVSAYSPCGVLEEELVRSIIETHWQLRRANLVDSELFEIYGLYKGQPRGVGTAFAQDATQGNAFSKLTRYQGFLLRKLHLAQKELWALKSQAAQALPLCQPVLGLNGAAVEIYQRPTKKPLPWRVPRRGGSGYQLIVAGVDPSLE
jgi:hypothetical protein